MKKILKLVFVSFIMLTLSMNIPVLAVGEETTPNDAYITIAATNDESSTEVNTLPNEPDNQLTKSDILNILLIATGIVIILLAIAIFVKLK